MSNTDSALQDLLDKQAITEVIYRYGRCMDRLDRELGLTVFWPEATADYHEFIDDDGTCIDSRNLGRYVDRWERRDGEWRIIERTYLHDFDQQGTSAGDFVTTSRRDRLDASYFPETSPRDDPAVAH